MTVSTPTNLVTYVGTGSTSSFVVPYRFLQNTDLVVTTNAPGGGIVTLALNADYTVTGTTLYAGGSITLTAGNLTAGYTLNIWRNPSAVQLTSLQNQGSYNATAVETALDLLTMQNDAQSTVDATCVRAYPGDTASMLLPIPSVRANKTLVFDASGNVSVGTVSGATILDVSLVQVVDTIAALRALPQPSSALQYLVRGYYVAGDGGGGTFRWNAADATVDNGGTVIIPNSAPAAGRWNRITDQSGPFNVLWYGAKGDGTTNDTAALVAAIASGHPILIPGGKTFLYTPPLIISVDGTCIIGENRYTSVLKPTATAANAIEIGDTVSSTFGFVMRDVRVTGNSTCNNGLVLGQAAPQHSAISATFERCYIENFNKTNADGLRMVAGWWLRISGCTFESSYNNIHVPVGSATTTLLIDQQTTIRNSVQHGVFLEGIAGSAKSLTLRTCSLEAAGGYAVYATSAQTILNIEDCYFELNHNDVSAHGSSTAYQYIVFQMDRCRSDGATGTGGGLGHTLDLDYCYESKVRSCPGFNNGVIVTTANVNVEFEQMNGSSAGDFLSVARTLLGAIYASEVVPATGRTERYASNGNTFEGHICAYQPTAPTATTGAGIGAAGAVAITANSTDTSGRIELTSGTSGWAADKMCRVTFNKAYNRNPIVVLTPASTKAGTQSRSKGVNVDVSTTWFDVYFETAENAAGLAYWNYHVIE